MLIGVKTAADLLCVSEKTIYRWVTAQTIPYTRAGNQYRFSRSELIAWASVTGKQLTPEAACEVETTNDPLPRLCDALDNGGIYYRVGGTTPAEIIEEIVSIMALPAGVDRSYLGSALAARETLASTGIGEGIAIPHPRHPLLPLDSPLLALAFLAQPVNWHAFDGVPVSILFILCCPNMRSHLHLLSRISFAARDAAWRELLRKEAMRNEILTGLHAVEEALYMPKHAKLA